MGDLKMKRKGGICTRKAGKAEKKEKELLFVSFASEWEGAWKKASLRQVEREGRA